MTTSNIYRPQAGRCLAISFVAVITLFPHGTFCVAQSAPKQRPEMGWSNDLNKYPGLLPELTHLFDRLQHEVEFPPVRAKSRILPLMSESTVFYAAFPNYGDASRQALEIFQQELRESSVLRNWWQHVNADSKINLEDALKNFHELSEYLGDEIVISGSVKGSEPSILFVAEVRKPGLKTFLQQMLAQLPATSRPALRILDQQDLATETDAPGQQASILVRPDFVIAASSVATLQSLNTGLSENHSTLSSTLFGRRLLQAYEKGLTIVAAADLQSLLKLVPEGSKDKEVALERSGFVGMKYLVWEHTTIGGRDVSQSELGFNGRRRGIASWLASPRRLGSLDFVSPKAMFTVSLALTSPAQIFDDIQELGSASASAANPNPMTMAAPMAQMLGVNLKDDLLNLLTGEIAIEVDSATPSVPIWRVMLGVKDAGHLQQTLNTLLAASHIEPECSEEGGLTYYSMTVPSPTKPMEIAYTFVDGYLLVGSSHETVTDAVRLHRSGRSLGKSESFLASLPPGHPAGVSGLMYDDPSAMMAMGLAQAPPEMKALLSQIVQPTTPMIIFAYGEQDAIRAATTSAAFDPTLVLLFGAVAIPNLLQTRTAANDASAVSTLRTVDTAEITYSAAYPERGFALNLAMLGTDPASPGTISADHAGLLDPTLGNPSCTASSWCVKNGYRFRVTAECRQKICTEFVAVATPVSTDTGRRNFCSTSEGMIRFRLGAPLAAPITAVECKSWQPLQSPSSTLK